MSVPLKSYKHGIKAVLEQDILDDESEPQDCGSCGAKMANHEVKTGWTPSGDYLLVHLKRCMWKSENKRLWFDQQKVVTPWEFESNEKHFTLFGVIINTGVSYFHGHYVTAFRVGSFFFNLFFPTRR